MLVRCRDGRLGVLWSEWLVGIVGVMGGEGDRERGQRTLSFYTAEIFCDSVVVVVWCRVGLVVNSRDSIGALILEERLD